MITTTPELAIFMDTARAAERHDLVTITTTTGIVLRYTSADFAVKLPDGRSFAKGPLIARDRSRLTRGIEVAEHKLSLVPRQADLVGAVPLLQFARSGGLRGCAVMLEWAYYSTARVFQGTMPRWYGKGSPTGLDHGVIEFMVRSQTDVLQQQMPRDVYQPRCLAQIFDPRCGKREADYLVTSAVSAVSPSTARSQFTSPLAQAAGYFNLGVVRFTTGANSGLQRTVRSFAGGVFTFSLPLPHPVAVGDAFNASPGCDGTTTTCQVRYANLLRFRGQPHIPAPEVTT